MWNRLAALAVLVLSAPGLAQTAAPDANGAPARPAAAVPAQPAARAPLAGVTPNAEREVEIAAIDKRTGQMEVFKGKPGQSFRFGAIDVRVRTCETTPPWEPKLSGAFLQIDERGRSGTRRLFSGWMFAQSPSLNPLEHPRYDVWVRACAMNWPDKGPDTVVVGGASRSSAEKSADATSAAANSER